VAKQTRRKRQEIPTTSLQLTYPALQVTVPHWSPDGKQIAFGGAKPGDPNGIYVIPAEGGSPEQISSGKSDLDPTWSKDAAHPDVAGSQNARRDLGRGSDGICCPRWSPDGRWVIALSADKQKLFLLDMSTQKWRQVADKIGIIGYMTWSRDSKYVGFDTSSPSIQHFVACLPPMDK